MTLRYCRPQQQTHQPQGTDENRRSEASDLHGTFDLQAPRRIWQSSEARIPRNVFSQTYDHSAQETKI
jgi:hypothetical protein